MLLIVRLSLGPWREPAQRGGMWLVGSGGAILLSLLCVVRARFEAVVLDAIEIALTGSRVAPNRLLSFSGRMMRRSEPYVFVLHVFGGTAHEAQTQSLCHVFVLHVIGVICRWR